MGFTGLDPKIEKLVDKLAKEYKLEVDRERVQTFDGWGKDVPPEEQIDKFCKNLEKLIPGKYRFVEHPAKDTPEMQSMSHKGNTSVATDRKWVTRVFTSEKVKETIRRKGIKLVSYAGFKKR